MESTPNRDNRHYLMSRVRCRNTKPEIVVRKLLHSAGFRFRLNVRSLPGTPDIVLSKYRTAIFINGCFWHGHDGCKYYSHPKTNSEFWVNKVKANKRRDVAVLSRLESLGWYTITIWECELKKEKLDDTLSNVIAQLKNNQECWYMYRERRKQDELFAREESQRLKTAKAVLEDELRKTYNIPRRIVELSHQTED